MTTKQQLHHQKRYHLWSILLLCLIILSSFPLSSADNPNTIEFHPIVYDVTIGEFICSEIYVDVHSEINTVAIDNLTFTPPGIIQFLTAEQGNIFSQAGFNVWIPPNPSGIHNDEGWVQPIVWSVGQDDTVNDVYATFCTISWFTNSIGECTLNISEGGTSLGGIDPGTTRVNGFVKVHPQKPNSFIASYNGSEQIDLSWNFGFGSDHTIVRGSNETYPVTTNDGDPIYNGTQSACLHNVSGETWYYSAWSFTNGFSSLEYISTTGSPDNQQPDIPSTPSPPDGSTEINVSENISWICGDPDGDPLTYDVYFGDDPIPDEDEKVSHNQSVPSYTPVLTYNTTYYWKIIAYDNNNFATESPIWSFTTNQGVNAPPYQPHTPIPLNNSSDEEIHTLPVSYTHLRAHET